MVDSLAAVVLAAGTGTRLRPLTFVRPKPLCPVGNVPLVDLALARARTVTEAVAVNVHHGRELLEAHLAGRVHLSVEAGRPLGTAGALGQLRPWIDGRPTLVVNADGWGPTELGGFVAGWDGRRVRLLTVLDPARGDFGDRRYVGVALLPWTVVAALEPVPSGLYEVCWQALGERGELELTHHDGPFVDCGTPADYLAANLASSGGRSVVGKGAVVGGRLERSVVWPGGVVYPGEELVDAVRVGDNLTVLVR